MSVRYPYLSYLSKGVREHEKNTFFTYGCADAHGSRAYGLLLGRHNVRCGKQRCFLCIERSRKRVFPAEENDLLAQIKEKGTITVAMEGTWAPWTYHDADDNLVGYDVEVAQNIAEKLGVEVNFVEGEWDGLLAGLDDGRYDIMVNGVGVTEERAEKYNFSTPYAYNRTAVIVRGDYDEINSMEDLEGKTTANTISSTYATQAEAHGATVTGVDDLNQTIELLLSGRIDATLNAEVVFADYVKEHPEANIKIATFSDEVEKVAIPIRKGDDTATLLAAVNDALKEMSEDGTLTALSEKYFGTDISKE